MKIVKDKTDEKIIQMLMKNSRIPFVDIAKRISVSEGTVRKRVKNLVENGIIERFTIETKRKGVGAIILIKTDIKYSTYVLAKKINKEIDAISAHVLAGDYNIAAITTSIDMDDLNKKVGVIRNIRGIISTTTLAFLS